MDHSAVTIVVVPRERFSFAARSLDSVLEHTPASVKLVYVDGGSPPPVRRFVERRASDRGFTLIRKNHYLSPNRARNAGLREVATKYVVFVDNDVLVSPHWLDALVDCAEQTGAWVVGPTYCEEEPAGEMIHMAGGEARIQTKEGRRRLIESHRHGGRRLTEVRSQLKREPCELVEFHCLLARREVFDRIGLLDEQLLSTREHVDFCLTIEAAGGVIYYEPGSTVTYVPPPPFAWSDLPFYLTRWSEGWNLASLRHFRAKWRLGDDDPQLVTQNRWLRDHRHIALAHLTKLLSATCGERVADRLQQRCLAPIEVVINRLLFSPSRRSTG